MKPRHAALYVRISKDDLNDGLGVERQEVECREYAERVGWKIAEVYADNDISAASGKRRKNYLRMLEDVETGRRDGILVWSSSRLTRTPRELEDVIESGVALSTVSGEIDLGTSQGRTVARILGAADRQYVESNIESIRSKHRQLAESGQSHGGKWRTFGHDAKRIPDATKSGGFRSEYFIVEEEAKVIRELAAQIIAEGEHFNLSAAARDLTTRGITAVTGKTFGPETLKSVLTRWRLAGIRALGGEPQGPEGSAVWPVILSESDLRAVRAALYDPKRRTNNGEPRKHLLSGMPICGKCGARLRAGANRNPDGSEWRNYKCKGGSCYLGIGRDVLDDVVLRHLSSRLTLPPSGSLWEFMEAEPEEVKALRLERVEIDAEIAEVAGSGLKIATIAPILRDLEARLDEVDKRISQYMHRDALKGLLTELRPLVKGSLFESAKENREAMRQEFEGLTLAKRRSIITALLRIEISESIRGKTKRSDAIARIKITDLDPATGEPVDEFEGLDPYADVG